MLVELLQGDRYCDTPTGSRRFPQTSPSVKRTLLGLVSLFKTKKDSPVPAGPASWRKLRSSIMYWCKVRSSFVPSSRAAAPPLCSSWVATRCCVSYIAGQRRERSFPLWTTARPRSRISLCVKNKTVCNNNCYSHALLFSMSATISPSPTIYATLF